MFSVAQLSSRKPFGSAAVSVNSTFGREQRTNTQRRTDLSIVSREAGDPDGLQGIAPIELDDARGEPVPSVPALFPPGRYAPLSSPSRLGGASFPPLQADRGPLVLARLPAAGANI
jgi:hypothetical protein